jgi:acetyl-CoA acetyltransferase
MPDAAIVGVGDVELEQGFVREGRTVLEIQAIAAKRALEDAGLTKDDVDGLFVAGMWGVPGPGVMPTLAVGEYLGIHPRYADGTNIGGSSFEAHIGHALAAIRAGLCEVALITYGSTQKSDRSRSLAGRPPLLQQQFETPFGLPSPVGSYAMAATRHMHQYGTRPEDLAQIAVNTRRWAQLNPAATMRGPLTVDDVLASPMISYPLHLLDCCLVTDGGGAVVLAAAHRARGLKHPPAWILGYGEAHDHAIITTMPDVTRPPSYESGRRAFQMAGLKPEEMDFAEIYDSFTITVLLTVEALGLAPPGEGAAFFANGRTAPGGAFPVNTNGGGLSYAHPGMYGIFLLIEAARQLWGVCGERQVPKNRLCVVNGTGGTLSSAATVILGRD